MCTVSYIPLEDKIILTSNRDEHQLRPMALAPRNYVVQGKNLVFPKDPLGGGTWFAVQSDKSIVVLLNGAEEKHEFMGPYRLSRGQIVLHLASSTAAITAWKSLELDKIEPFTIVLFALGKLYQMRWNGNQKSLLELNPKSTHFWSSTTLYSTLVREKRESWFASFVRAGIKNESDIFHFHRYAHAEDRENGLIIDRTTGLKTQSICQVILEKNNVRVSYIDLNTDQQTLCNVLAL